MRLMAASFLCSLLSISALGQDSNTHKIASGNPPDKASATSMPQFFIDSVAVDSAGDTYFSSRAKNAVFRVDAVTGQLARIAGSGKAGYSGDNRPAIGAALNAPQPHGGVGVAVSVAVDAAGNVYIADWGNNAIRKVANGIITTIAGNGKAGYSGDGGPATSAQITRPAGVAVDAAGNVYIADARRNAIRKVANGIITTIAGGGAEFDPAYTGPATSAALNGPTGVAVDAAGNLYVADRLNNVIRKVADGIISTIAGNGKMGYTGDDGPATGASLYLPVGVAVDASGNVYITDGHDNVIRKVSTGVIATIAGNGSAGYSGDNGPATKAELYDPMGVAVDAAGNVYIADSNNDVVRKVSNGVITTIALGSHASSSSGEVASKP
ncbi:MAG: hypothetical protein ABSG25_06185 [Bryobacteraceae bacterium]